MTPILEYLQKLKAIGESAPCNDAGDVLVERSGWDKLIEMNQTLVEALERIEEWGCNKDSVIDQNCISSNTAKDAIAKVEAMIGEKT